MLDYNAILQSESRRFRDRLASIELGSAVPSCPEWDAADLLWHLAEVQYFWARIVEDLLDDPAKVEDLARPDDGALLELFDQQSARLSAALTARSDDERCWSWSSQGGTAGWVRRRQAHEALIHRADADLAAGVKPSLDDAVAVDGVDELVENWFSLDGLPEWATFTPEDDSIRLETGDDPSWDLVFGRFAGTSPTSGNTYDDDDVAIADPAPERPTAAIAGPASALNLWLWGRGSIDDLEVTGDRALADRLRAIVAGSTQ